MNKLEKYYYAIIENKKRGKFYGVGSIEVAKKVASKKLKAGKEMEFYLDEVSDKKKRFGPYQARKDKKTGQIAVVKGRKVMKGGLLNSSEQDILIRIFNENCSYLKRPNEQKIPFIKQVSFNDIKIYFVAQSVLIFFKKNDEEQIYTHAIFVDPNRTYVWILKKRLNSVIIFINFADFFLNPNYLNKSEREYIIMKLKLDISLIRSYEANIINPILLAISSVIVDKNRIGIYSPDYSHPLIKKCVYPDLTFGVLNEEKLAQRDIQRFEIPENVYQRFLILKNTGIRGMSFNEPIIYVRDTNILQNQSGGTLTVEKIQNNIRLLQKELNSLKTIHKSTYRVYKPQPNTRINPVQTYWQPSNTINYQKNKKRLINKESIIEQLKQELQQLQQEQIQQLQQEQLQQEQFQQKPEFQQHKLAQFDYCIYSSGNKLKIMSNNLYNIQDFILMGNNLISIPIQIFKNLMDIPQYFGEFRRIRQISDMCIRQQKPRAFVPQIIPESRTTRQVPQVSYQQEPLTINFFEKKIRDLFMESTIKNLKINIDILLKNLKPIIENFNQLKVIYQNNENNPELQVKLLKLYRQLGIKFKNAIRESQLAKN